MQRFSRKQVVTLILLFVGLTTAKSIDTRKRIFSTDPQKRLAWYEQHVAMKETSLFKQLEWRFIGPEIMSGRLTDVAVPPGTHHTILIAAASGGVWRSTNEGTTWEPIFEHAPSTSIGDIAVDPLHPEVIWVGTGEANIFRSSMAGCGIYKSIDNGETWQHMGLAGTHTIPRIVIHPKNPDIVYVAASGHEWTNNKDRGIYQTTDGGKTWKKILYINESTGAIDLVMDPSDPQTLYASMWNRVRKKWSDPKPGENDAIYKTIDGGQTWSKKIEGLPPLDKIGRIGLDVARSNPNVLYALMDNHHPSREPKEGEEDSYGRERAEPIIKGAEVYRSDDKGETWRKVSESSREMERLFATYGWVFGQICVDPNDENTVYIMGVPLYKSTDGGKTFFELDYPGLHADHHAMWIDPDNSNYILSGNDGGLNISYDGGETWKNLLQPGAVQFYNVAVDMHEPFRVYGSIQDNGCYRGPVTYRPGKSDKWEWEGIPGGEASYLAVDPENPNILYNESFYGRIRRSEFKDGEWDTKQITPKTEEGEPELRGQWLAPFILSSHNSSIVYHGMQYVFRSMNQGETWDKISPDLTYNDPDKQGDISFQTITSLSESPLCFGLLYAGTDDGKVHVTQNGGRTWKKIMKKLPYQKWVSRIVASRYDEATVYLTQNGKRDDDFQVYVFKSTNYGEKWLDISANIPCGPVNVIHEDPKNKDVLYVGTDLGVYVTVDGGQSWNVLANNLPTTFVQDLLVHPRDQILVAGTHGRGAWVMDVGILQKIDDSTFAKDVHLFDVENAKLPKSKRRWDRDTIKKASIYYYLNASAEPTLFGFHKLHD